MPIMMRLDEADALRGVGAVIVLDRLGGDMPGILIGVAAGAETATIDLDTGQHVTVGWSRVAVPGGGPGADAAMDCTRRHIAHAAAMFAADGRKSEKLKVEKYRSRLERQKTIAASQI